MAVAPCPLATTTAPYIDNLEAAVGASGLPSGYSRWSTISNCNPSGTVTAPAGNWLIDCPGDLRIGNGTTVTIPAGNVIFDGGLNMTGGLLRINTSNPTSSLPATCKPPAVTTPCIGNSTAAASFVYSRSGSWDVTGGTITLNHVMHYQANGDLKLRSNPPTWHGPTEGPFAGLAFWSEASAADYSVAGGSGMAMSGVFFTPEAAPFSLTGNGTWGQQSAQFITFQLKVSGGSSASFVPNFDNAVTIPPTAGVLIR